MSLVADDKTSGQSFDPIPAGTYHAVCYSVVDLGTQTTIWQEKEKKQRKVLITWELPEVRIDIERDDGKVDLPRAISRRYTISTHEKSNLGKDLVSWLGRKLSSEERAGYDVRKLAGANALLTIIHREWDGKTYANVSSVAKPMLNMLEKKAENPIVIYDMGTDGFNFPPPMPDWVIDVIKKSDEWMASQGESPPDEPSDDFDPDNPDGIPF